MKLRNPFKDLTRFELGLWLFSVISISILFLFASQKDYLTLIASLIGVTALIFVSKGYVFGQILVVVFSIFYGIISIHFKYYGEMITYLGMSTPIAILTAIEWLKNPYKKTAEVTVNTMTNRQIVIMLTLASVVTFAFYFILKALQTTNLIISTISVATSFVAAYLTLKRSAFYAIGYALNDIVLIILWVLATIVNISYMPMIACFVIFFINDLYGFYNWQRMKKRQANGM
ncbi:MAG TPA: nicotinamide mononucleotide transporter [Clostridiales bacterium]|jgi:nicotinamide mononucleotide transporter PnuC|nr:nicotinamide mononucleotide transporter [Clostridiales bacterium]